MPSKIYNFVKRYLNNSLATLKNMLLWGTSNSMSCLDCGNSQTLLHVMSGCEKHLHQGHYTWRHNSVLKALASFLLPRGIGELYVDLQGFFSPSEVTGDSKRPDMLIVRRDGTLYKHDITRTKESFKYWHPSYTEMLNNKKRSHTQLDSRKQVIAFQDRVITINIKEAQHPLKREKQVIDKSSIMLKISTKSMHGVLV